MAEPNLRNSVVHDPGQMNPLINPIHAVIRPYRINHKEHNDLNYPVAGRSKRSNNQIMKNKF